ncbi:hypothetical protein OG233_18920 [Streptomyces sp. NBC_01218]|uniref:hypothetical protein n=1 Tax=unclassified Streptomyces TaxID=2593676 RepID=UPI002E165755|nr:hypothetical protein OG233_18920 [Streptomyces sp. NBC_01218]
MAWVVGAGGFLGLLVIALGIVALRTGWILPTTRRHVTRPRLYGLGGLLTGASVLVQSLLYFGILPSVAWDVRFYGGIAFLLAGLFLIALSQLLPLRRNGVYADPSGT